MITFEEFADAYAAAVQKILAKMKYLERIGRDPFDESKPLPKWWHKANNLKERRKPRPARAPDPSLPCCRRATH